MPSDQLSTVLSRTLTSTSPTSPWFLPLTPIATTPVVLIVAPSTSTSTSPRVLWLETSPNTAAADVPLRVISVSTT